MLENQLITLKFDNEKKKGPHIHLFRINIFQGNKNGPSEEKKVLLSERIPANNCVRNGRTQKSPFCNL